VKNAKLINISLSAYWRKSVGLQAIIAFGLFALEGGTFWVLSTVEPKTKEQVSLQPAGLPIAGAYRTSVLTNWLNLNIL
jgi:hypothetical protein